MFGLDLGHTSACVAAFQNERVDVVSNDYGNRTTPCLVLYDPATQEHLIGEPAVAKAAKLQASPEATALTPAKIAQVQMSKMKTDAEAFIGQQMNSVVIAVAPRVTAEERDVLTKAANKVGVKSVRYLHSAIAVMLAHGADGAVPWQPATPVRENVVVFRLGGRHADAYVVSAVAGTFTVLSSVTDDSVGGSAFEDALVQHCCVEFRKKYRMDVSGGRALLRLKGSCEEAKRSLSINARVSIEVDSLFEGLDFSTVITRPRFEDLCHSLIRNVTKPVEAALAAAGLTPANIDRVLLAGGTSRIPRVKDAITALFPATTVVEMKGNPEETVATGATIAASLVGKFSTAAPLGGAGGEASHGKKGKGGGKAGAAHAGPVLEDVLDDTTPLAYAPASVGVAASDGRLSVCVPRLALLPSSGHCKINAPVVGGIATVTLYQGDVFEVAAVNRALAELPLRVSSSADVICVHVSVVVTRHGGVCVRVTTDEGESSILRIGHGEDVAPKPFEEQTPVPPTVVDVTEMVEVEVPSPAATPVPAPAPAAAPVPSPAVKAAPAPAPQPKAAVPFVAADDLD